MILSTVDCNDQPEEIGKFYLSEETEMMAYLYFPVIIPGHETLSLEPRLERYRPMIEKARMLELGRDYPKRFIYVSAKSLVVGPTVTGNRPGWHCDGFGTTDVNYIWYDSSPTIFSHALFNKISKDHGLAIKQFDEIAEANQDLIYSFEENTLVRLTSKVVHHTPKHWVPGFRNFVKISFSDHEYNLQGNTRNYNLKYNWTMHSRSNTRNMENSKHNEKLVSQP